MKRLNWLQKIMILVIGSGNEPVKGTFRLLFMVWMVIKSCPLLRKSPYIREFEEYFPKNHDQFMEAV